MMKHRGAPEKKVRKNIYTTLQKNHEWVCAEMRQTVAITRV
jgi:hypothetical protein